MSWFLILNFQNTDNGHDGFPEASTKADVKFLPYSSSLEI